jgi:hypothetical protein
MKCPCCGREVRLSAALAKREYDAAVKWEAAVNCVGTEEEPDWMGDAPPDPPPGMSVPVGFEVERKKHRRKEKK